MVPLFTSIGGGDTLSPLEAGKDFPSKKGANFSPYGGGAKDYLKGETFWAGGYGKKNPG